jgi:FixJ family two-component response regulator
MDDRLTVYIVDDDASIRDSLALLLGLRGFRCACFADAESFLGACSDDWTGCVVADLRLPGQSGLEMQRALHERGNRLPFLVITAHGDIAAARDAFKLDAVDFIEKPFDDNALIGAIESAFQRETARLEHETTLRTREAALAVLTEREHEVAELLVLGHRPETRDQPADRRSAQGADLRQDPGARSGRPDPHPQHGLSPPSTWG